jgi:DNA-binding winged helix-turn-helix (wHTH) protein
MDADRRVTFAGFCPDLGAQQLLCGDEVVALTSKAFSVLRRLAEDGGQLVSKTKLRSVGSR